MKADVDQVIETMFDNKRQYQIPVYQRNYDWKKDNCIQLFNDILSANEKDCRHFLGSIVQVQQDEENGIKHFIIIDGQQRMTSIYLLLKALYDKETNITTKEQLEQLLYNYSSAKLFDQNEKNKLKLKPIKTDNVQFSLLMSNKQDLMDRTSNIYINYNCFLNLIDKAIKNEIETRAILRGLTKLDVVLISLHEPNDDPQVIFERINSTGEDLTLADLIRNYLLMTNKEMDKLFEEYWLPMESSVGKDLLSDYFKNYIIFKIPDSLKGTKDYQIFKKYADNFNKENVLKDLKYYSKFYKVFIEESDLYSKEVNNILNGYRILKQSTIFPFLFPIFDDFERKIIDEKTLVNVLTLFLNYTIRRAITGVPTNSLRGFYKTLYKRIFVNDTLRNNYYENICIFMATINTKDAMPKDTIFKDNLMSENLYKNKNVCKYLLSIVENGISYIKEKVNIDSGITIEHIMPQNKDNEDWQKEIGKDFPFVYDRYLHTLGNLTLTGYNSELSDHKFLDKVELLKANSKFIKLNKSIIANKCWDEDKIKLRAEELSSIIVNEFKLPEIFKKNIVVKNSLQKFNAHDSGKLANTKPNYYIFMGEKCDVSTYREMLLNLCESLYNYDSKKFNDLALNNYKLDNAKLSLISYDSTIFRTAREIGNTSIYIETNFSSDGVIRVIKHLLEIFELADDDFIFYASYDN